jgi:putative membrane protein
VAGVTPGLSGGVLMAALGLYEPALAALTGLRRDFRASMAFLLPLAVGGGLGVLLFGGVMHRLYAAAPDRVIFAFLGLVCGAFPAFFREANRDGFRKTWLIALAAAFGLALIGGAALPVFSTAAGLSTLACLLCGGIVAAGLVIPGVSASFVLIRLGLYAPMLAAIADFDVPALIWMAVGGGVTALALVYLAAWAFRRARGPSYYAVAGFLAASSVVVFPGLGSGGGAVLNICLFCLGAAGSYFAMGRGRGAH